MSDQTERIVVEVDGSAASEGFNRIRAAAESANAALNQTTTATNNAQKAVDGLLGITGRTASGLKNVADAAGEAKKKIDDAGDAAHKGRDKFDLLQQSLFGVRGKAAFIWDLAADGFRMAMGFADSFIDRTSAIQRTFSLLATIPGNSADGEFEYLTRTANNYGLSLKAIQDDYAKLNLAAQNTTLTSEGVRRVFEQVSLATRTLHLNQQQTQLTFLAVEQMLSKGKVSMEELRKQFAERVPGALQALARELGVSYDVFDKFITKVGAASDKIVPELGNAIQRLYQDALPNAVRALDAERNRLETSVTMFFKNVVSAGGTEGMATLLRSVGELLQTETVAQVFADAMNKITGNITEFIRSLRPGDIENFAKVTLDFLSAFTTLTIGAANAVIFLGQHLPQVAAAFGAFAGAQVGAAFGPVGVAIGTFVGGVGGYIGGLSVQGASSGAGELPVLYKQYESLNTQVQELQALMDERRTGFLGRMGINPTKRADTYKLNELIAQRDALKTKIEPMMFNATRDQSPLVFDMPEVGDMRGMIAGTPEQQMAELVKRFGLSGKDDKKPSAAALAAARLATRQTNAIADLAAKLRGLREPEEDSFDTIETNFAQMGIKSGHPQFVEMKNILVELRYYKNKKAQDASDKKTLAKESQFTNMMTSAGADIGKFREKFNTENLQQVDDNDWATKARKMGSDLDSMLIEQRARWDKMAKDNPLFDFGFDRDKKLAEMKEIGDAYINEFKRIEAEKRTVMGGTKSFLKDWNANAENFGKITQDFLQGVADNTTDMLFNMVRHGEFSFKKLTLFVLEYITKMMIVQSITPMVNSFAGFLSSSLGSLLGAGASATSSMYSLSGGGGGLGLKMRANGGPVWPGEPFVVGERGPEVVTFDRPGYVHPNVSPQSGSGGNISVQVNIDAKGNTSLSGDGAAASLGRRIGDAVRAVLVDEMRPGGMLA